ncbi:hypothetical protein BI335_04875 [Enemella evansiae]|nr:hypothetical protein BI335_04875 [Enemella evansiae]
MRHAASRNCWFRAAWSGIGVSCDGVGDGLVVGAAAVVAGTVLAGGATGGDGTGEGGGGADAVQPVIPTVSPVASVARSQPVIAPSLVVGPSLPQWVKRPIGLLGPIGRCVRPGHRP